MRHEPIWHSWRADPYSGFSGYFHLSPKRMCMLKLAKLSSFILDDSSGVFAEWSEWSECTVSCGGGVQNSQRVCDGTCDGPTTRSQACNQYECPGQ